MVAIIVLNLAYAVLLGATFTRTAVALRLMIVVGSLGFVAFGLMADIPTMTLWNSITAVFHLVALIRIAAQRRAKTTEPQADWIRTVVFADLESPLFNRLWAASSVGHYTNHFLTLQGESHGRLAVVLSGVVEVCVDGQLVNQLGPGAMLGEMSLSSGAVATADTKAVGPVIIREWDRDALLRLASKEGAIGRSIDQAALRSTVTKMQARPAAPAPC